MSTLIQLLSEFDDKYLYDAEHVRYGKLQHDLRAIKELEEKLAEAERTAMQNGCDRNKAEFKLAIAIEALEKIAGEYYCRETGRYIDDAKEALEKIKG